MRYYIDFDRLVNQLVPHYLGGRKLILYLQSCVKPLQLINDIFVTYAKETLIEATMTSQVFRFEWFLNRKFRQYFLNPNESITIRYGGNLGIPVFYQSANDIEDKYQLKLWQEDEELPSNPHPAFYFENESANGSGSSFVVYVPQLWEELDDEGNPTGILRDRITKEQFISMLSYWINRYRLAGKTYQIIINTQ